MELFGQNILDFPDDEDSVGFFAAEAGPRVAQTDEEYLLDLGLTISPQPMGRKKTPSISLHDVNKKLQDWGLVIPSCDERQFAELDKMVQDDSADSVFSDESCRSEISEEIQQRLGLDDISSKENSYFCDGSSFEQAVVDQGDAILFSDSIAVQDTCEISECRNILLNLDNEVTIENSIETSFNTEPEMFLTSDSVLPGPSSPILANDITDTLGGPQSEDICDDNSNCSSDLGYFSPIKEDPLSEIDISSILSAKSIAESDSLTSRSSDLIGGANCDFIEELKGLKSSESNLFSEPQDSSCADILGFDEESLIPDSNVQEEEGINCDLDMFDFNLAQECEKIESELEQVSEEVIANDTDSSNEKTSDLSDFWSEIFSASEELADSNNTEYDELLDSILSSTDSLDSEYFKSLTSNEFDIDSVDPTCKTNSSGDLHSEQKTNVEKEKEKKVVDQIREEIKEEVVEISIKEEVCETIKIEPSSHVTSHLYPDHDYTLPSSLYLTPPHTPGKEYDSDSESSLPYTVKYGHKDKHRSLLNQKHHSSDSRSSSLVKSSPNSKTKSQIIKFQHKKDLKFVINLAVQNDSKKTNARSILKNKILENRGRDFREKVANIKKEERPNHKPMTAKELMKEVVERRVLTKDIQEKREYIKNMKKRLRQESREERSLQPKAKYRCIEDVGLKTGGHRNMYKPDDKKYRKFEEERELHNSMERQRRNELKDNYDNLKAVIPSISSVEKVSKLMILNTASDYCKSLDARVGRLELIKQREEETKRHLQEKLNLLNLHIVL